MWFGSYGYMSSRSRSVCCGHGAGSVYIQPALDELQPTPRPMSNQRYTLTHRISMTCIWDPASECLVYCTCF